jgi:predicted ATPase
LLSDNLSDGEFAFLSRMALIYLLNENECLFLLDEPEVHFNDDWKRNLVDSIERALVGTHSEVVLTSHASIVLTDAYPDEVILLTEYGQEDTIPLIFAAEQGEVLRMLFESEHSVGKRAMRHVKKIVDEESPEKVEKLKKLLDQVGPGYYRFKIVRELQRLVPPDQKD